MPVTENGPPALLNDWRQRFVEVRPQSPPSAGPPRGAHKCRHAILWLAAQLACSDVIVSSWASQREAARGTGC